MNQKNLAMTEQNTPLPHDLQIKLDLDLYGIAYEKLMPDGTIERIDPTTIRTIRSNEKESIMKPITEHNTPATLSDNTKSI